MTAQVASEAMPVIMYISSLTLLSISGTTDAPVDILLRWTGTVSLHEVGNDVHIAQNEPLAYPNSCFKHPFFFPNVSILKLGNTVYI